MGSSLSVFRVLKQKEEDLKVCIGIFEYIGSPLLAFCELKNNILDYSAGNRERNQADKHVFFLGLCSLQV